MQYYVAGLTVGLILLQTAIVAPSLAKTLSREEYGVSSRTIWTKFFLLLSGLGIATLMVLWLTSWDAAIPFVIAGCTVVLPAICDAMIPAPNRATDPGDTSLLKKLHVASVLLTVGVLIGNIGFLFTG